MLNGKPKSRRGIALAVGLSVVTGAGATPWALSAAMAQSQQNQDEFVVESLDITPNNGQFQPGGGPGGGGSGGGGQGIGGSGSGGQGSADQPPAGFPPGGPINPFSFGSGGYSGGGGSGGGGGLGNLPNAAKLMANASLPYAPEPIWYNVGPERYDLNQPADLQSAISDIARDGVTNLADLLNFASSKGVKLQTLRTAIETASQTQGLSAAAQRVLTQASTRIATAMQRGASGEAVNVAFTLKDPGTQTASIGQPNVENTNQPNSTLTPSPIYIG